MTQQLKNALIVYNPVSGLMPSRSQLFDLVLRLSEHDYVSTVYMTRLDRATRSAIAEYAPHADLVVCCGGDGTLHDVINGLLGAGLRKPLGYIPIGTTNDFAAAHGIPQDFGAALDTITRGGLTRLDTGLLNGREYFTYIACFGAFTRSTYLAPQTLKNMLGYLAYLIEGSKDLGALNNPTQMKIIADGRCYEGDFVFGAVVNSLNVGGIFRLPVTYDELDDGLLEVVLIRQAENLAELSQIAESILSGNYHHPKALLFKSRRVEFIASEPVAWNVDGEFAGDFKDAVIDVCGGALEIIT